MALKSKLDDGELALLEVLQDPIWFGTFLRRTSDGSIEKNEWPKERPWEYNWYQKDLLTDKTEYIALTGGRAIGKCSPWWSKIYTYEYGYQTITYLLKSANIFSVYALNKDNKFVQRRAKIAKNGQKDIYTVTTKTGITFDGTENHPILTPNGWKNISDLVAGVDKVAVVTRLPYESNQNMFNWFELRWLGMVLAGDRVAPQVPMKLKWVKQVAEIQAIAKYFDANVKKEDDGSYRLVRKIGPLKSYMTYLLSECECKYANKMYIRYIPKYIMRERLENIQIFLEAMFGMFGEFSSTEIKLKHVSKRFLEDVSELLLRFGVETRIEKVEEKYELRTFDYYSFFNFFNSFTNIPGISVKNLAEPSFDENRKEDFRFESIEKIEHREKIMTYAIHVYEDHNYISDGLIVHNSIIWEDKIIHESVNNDMYFPAENKGQLLATANKAQLDPLLSNIISRLLNGPMLRDFLNGNVNRSMGTMEFKVTGSSTPYRITARIAGLKGETNMVGLHIPRAKFDEAQLFPMPAWVQVQPAINTWQKPYVQVLVCGVN